MAPFDKFSHETLVFLRDLKSNNTRDWFAAHKTSYELHLKTPGQQFSEAMALALHDLTGHSHSSKIFRVHRDVRFSKDKTPYNTHLRVAFMPDAYTGQAPGWYFGLDTEKISLGCGVFQYEKTALPSFRSAMEGTQGQALIQLSAELRSVGVRVADPGLKRVPSGYDKNHPNEEALRRKGFTAWIDIQDTTFVLEPGLVERITTQFTKLMPVFRLLSQVD